MSFSGHIFTETKRKRAGEPEHSARGIERRGSEGWQTLALGVQFQVAVLRRTPQWIEKRHAVLFVVDLSDQGSDVATTPWSVDGAHADVRDAASHT